VVIECRIDTSGHVSGVRVMSGHPLLNHAAVAAVRQWRYSPTQLDGVPVAVQMTVTVRFDLRR
jgi:TonB family protein